MLFMFFSFLPLHPFASCLLLSSRILCISLYFNLKKTRSPLLAFIAKDKPSGPFNTSQV